MKGPRESLVLVGRRIEHEQKSLAWLAGRLAATGLIVLAVGLLGGWVLSRRAVHPIERMSAAASSISATHLSQRIDVTGVDSELENLASILNDMFSPTASLVRPPDAVHRRRIARTAHPLCRSSIPRPNWRSPRPRSAEEYREAMETCLRAARRMRNLVDGLLTLARADAGNLILVREEIDLGGLVEETVALLTPLAERKGVKLRMTGGPVSLYADAGQLGQLVTNLLTNAIHYNRPGGKVSATLTASETEVELSVADTGCGIPEEDRCHIFERFYRVDKARSREQGGCGLGLAICKSIVEGHGGSIGFLSEVDKGTTFLVRLPRRRPAETVAGGQASSLSATVVVR